MLEVEITKIKGPIGKGSAKATVDGQLACRTYFCYSRCLILDN